MCCKGAKQLQSGPFQTEPAASGSGLLGGRERTSTAVQLIGFRRGLGGVGGCLFTDSLMAIQKKPSVLFLCFRKYGWVFKPLYFVVQQVNFPVCVESKEMFILIQ